ncbi:MULTISPECIES: acyl-CoA dehydrogenase family protein [Marinobacter]|jgi:(2S)-methylsuccinyl-CoA dehydrogenase|uniref:acyl-CoA dehydrogenase family protein n=3 Tax=Marinobacteraceae TaxID=2887365 RepID=UPI001BCAB678|nr:acyl-CoA dehydrogenase family protein [Marinobacter salarius]MBS8232590.1 acyl-CoA dehydrogenase [Marinobacter salarius]WOI17943.1 acyl-CoA dehydrogenase family protein [Marinobacter salarius]
MSVGEQAVALGLADSSINTVDQFVRRGLKNLKTFSIVDGKLDGDLLDKHQLSCYELAFCTAELAAAREVCVYARKVGDDDSLATDAALGFSSEAVTSALQRLLARATDLGLDVVELSALFDDSAISVLRAQYGSAEFLAGIGSAVADRGSSRLPTLLSDDKEMVRDMFARFGADVVDPLAEKIHRHDLDIPDEILKQAAELGCFGISIPERFGGLQPDDRDDSLGMIVVTEELSKASLGAAGSLITRPEIAAKALLQGGTVAQQETWLPQIASGEKLCAIAITEPNFGSDVASLGLKATPVEGGWVLNGSKTWCTFAGKASLLLAMARTEKDPALGHKGLSLFLVEKPAATGHEFRHQQPEGGVIQGKAIATLGYRGMHSYDVFFEDYFVPADCLIGEENGRGKGFYFTMAGFAGGRIQTAARATGVMQAAFEKALSYSRERKVFGNPVGDYQLTQVKLGRIMATLTASRQFSYAVARMMDEGAGQMEASLVKLFSCRAAEWVTREAMQIHGGMGYAEETAVSRYFVDARVLSIFEGAEETLALKVIARNLVANA